MPGFALGAKARLAGYRLQGFDSIGSTNSEAMAAAQSGDPGGIWFAALQQTAGRGRRGRPWINPHGNLAASILVVPDAPPAMQASLGFVAGIALRQALDAVLPERSVKMGIDGADLHGGKGRIALKWPNDLLADGAKLAGILLEATKLPDGRQAVVAGIGVNVVSSPTDVPYPATSLAALGGSYTAQDVFEALSDAWVDAFGLWDEGRGLAQVLELWREAAAGIGAPVAVTQEGEVLRGTFEAIDDQGRLIVLTNDNRRLTITAGDVHFGATASARS